jgi:hypothetical protein
MLFLRRLAGGNSKIGLENRCSYGLAFQGKRAENAAAIGCLRAGVDRLFPRVRSLRVLSHAPLQIKALCAYASWLTATSSDSRGGFYGAGMGPG